MFSPPATPTVLGGGTTAGVYQDDWDAEDADILNGADGREEEDEDEDDMHLPPRAGEEEGKGEEEDAAAFYKSTGVRLSELTDAQRAAAVSFMRLHPPHEAILRMYDNLVKRVLPDILKGTIEYKNAAVGLTVRLIIKDVSVARQQEVVCDRSRSAVMTALRSKESKRSYALNVFVDLQQVVVERARDATGQFIYNAPPKVTVKECCERPIAKLPKPVGYESPYSPAARAPMGTLSMGDFIVNGQKRKVHIMTETITNVPMTFQGKLNGKLYIKSVMYARRETTYRSTCTIQMRAQVDRPLDIVFELAHPRKQVVSLWALFMLLGVPSLEGIRAFLWPHGIPEAEAGLAATVTAMLATQRHASLTAGINDPEKLIATFKFDWAAVAAEAAAAATAAVAAKACSRESAEYHSRQRKVNQFRRIVYAEIMPQQEENWWDSAPAIRKLFLLGSMAHSVATVHGGLRPADNRDSPLFHRHVGPDFSLGVLTRAGWAVQKRAVRAAARKQAPLRGAMDLIDAVTSSTITSMVFSGFVTGHMGQIPGSRTRDQCIQLKSDMPIDADGTADHLPVGPNTAANDIRQLNPCSWGEHDPLHTPDGPKCGIRRHRVAGSVLRVGMHYRDFLAIVVSTLNVSLLYNIPVARDAEAATLFGPAASDETRLEALNAAIKNNTFETMKPPPPAEPMKFVKTADLPAFRAAQAAAAAAAAAAQATAAEQDRARAAAAEVKVSLESSITGDHDHGGHEVMGIDMLDATKDPYDEEEEGENEEKSSRAGEEEEKKKEEATSEKQAQHTNVNVNESVPKTAEAASQAQSTPQIASVGVPPRRLWRRSVPILDLRGVPFGRFLVQLNGRIIGALPLGMTREEAVEKLRTVRRRGLLPCEASISITELGVDVTCDYGAFLRPVVRVEYLGEFLGIVNAFKGVDSMVERELLRRGILEYMDNNEVFSTRVAIASDAVQLRQHFKTCHSGRYHTCTSSRCYTHIELSPTIALMGTTLASIPFANANQLPRLVFTSMMLQQSAYVTSSCNDMPASLLNGNRQLVYTLTDDYNSGVSFGNVIHLGHLANHRLKDDALIFNKRSVELGCLSFMRVMTYQCMRSQQRDRRICNPTKVPNLHSRCFGADYGHLDEHGVIRRGTVLGYNTVLIGCVQRKAQSGNETGRRVLVDVSVVHKTDMFGLWSVVDVQIGTPTNGAIVIVTLRRLMRLQHGDKTSTTHGQKTTVSHFLNASAMPYEASTGIPLDAAMNILSQPSRKTDGQSLELWAGRAAALVGRRIDATTFGYFQAKNIRRVFLDRGLPTDGTNEFNDGALGTKYGARVFSGYILQLLLSKHNPENKVWARGSVGPNSLTTRQPAEGRGKEGGMRFGIMEYDAVDQMGPVHVKTDVGVRSDPAVIPVCGACGRIGKNPPYDVVLGAEFMTEEEAVTADALMTDALNCAGCGGIGTMRRTAIQYAFVLGRSTLLAGNMDVRIGTSHIAGIEIVQ